jgi:hypothetical protein
MSISGRLLQAVRNVAEGAVEAAAYCGDGDNDCDRNAGRDQAVFDGGGALFVAQESFEEFHSSSPDHAAGITRRALSNGEALTCAFSRGDDFPQCRPPQGSFLFRIRGRRRKGKGPGSAGAFRISKDPNAYLSALETLLKVVFNFEPTPWMTAMIATEMQAAIRPYSMAVAPDSSFMKRAKVFMFRAP